MTWTGHSGTEYTYTIFDINTFFLPYEGNYIFAREDGDYWYALYIGQTSNLQDRISDHEKWPCVSHHGATHIHVHFNTNRLLRQREETDLLRALATPCND